MAEKDLEYVYDNIVLSGLPCSGKSSIAKGIAFRLSWPVKGIGQLWRARWAELYPSGEVSFEEYWKNTSLEENREMEELGAEVFSKRGIVGDARYPFYCDKQDSLLVFVSADLRIRAERALNTGRYEGWGLDQVMDILAMRESDEVAMGRELYGADYDYRDANNYHLVINSGVFSLQEEVEIISSLMNLI